MKLSLLCLVLAAALAHGLPAARAPRKVIIDCDAGVDDGFALALLLSADTMQEVEVLAITTVSGNTDARNASLNVLKVLETAGRMDVPVYQGTEFTMDKTPDYEYFFGYDGFGDIDYPNAPNASLLQPTHGVLALLQIVQNNPGEVTLLCLGPLTNFALAQKINPSFSQQLSQLVVLGGAVAGLGNTRPGVEFNFFFDPLAASVLFSSGRKAPFVLVPWETVALNASLPMSWRTDVLGALPGPVMALLNRAEEQYLASQGDRWVQGDILAAAVMLNPGLVVSSVLQVVEVEVHAALLSGASVVDHTKKLGIEPNTRIVKMIDLSAYQAMLLKYLAS